MLNKLLNASIVIAVFVTALAIQRIVPTEQVATPKVEVVAAELPVAPVAPVETLATPEATPAVAATPESAPATVPAVTAQAPASTPAVAPVAQPCVTPAPQPVIAKTDAPASRKTVTRASRRANRDEYSGGRREDFKTSLNSGGAEDLDNPSMREHYINTSKLAKRVAPQAPAPEAQRNELAPTSSKSH